MQMHPNPAGGRDVADLPRMFILLEETAAAARTLYELFPDRLAVEPLYNYLENALHELSTELGKLSGVPQ